MTRILTEEQREKRREQARRRWKKMTPEQREAYRKRERERRRASAPEVRAARNERARARRKAWTREQKDEHNRKQRARYHKQRELLCAITKESTTNEKPVEQKSTAGLWQSSVATRRKRRAKNQQKRFVFEELLPYGKPCGIVYMVNKQAQKAPKFIYPEDYVGVCRSPEQYQDIEPVKASRIHEFDWDAPDLDAQEN